MLRLLPDIEDGIGLPEWRLTLCLAASWLIIFLTLVRGVQSSGKVAYFTGQWLAGLGGCCRLKHPWETEKSQSSISQSPFSVFYHSANYMKALTVSEHHMHIQKCPQ